MLRSSLSAKFRKVAPCARPAGASGSAKLFELAVEGLPVDRDAGIADKPFLRMSFGHTLWQHATL